MKVGVIKTELPTPDDQWIPLSNNNGSIRNYFIWDHKMFYVLRGNLMIIESGRLVHENILGKQNIDPISAMNEYQILLSSVDPEISDLAQKYS